MQLRGSMRLVSALAFAGTIDVQQEGATRFVRIIADAPLGTSEDAIFLAGEPDSAGAWRPDGVRLRRQPDGSYAGEIALVVGSRFEFKFTRTGDWATVEKTALRGERPNHVASIGPNTQRLYVAIEAWA